MWRIGQANRQFFSPKIFKWQPHWPTDSISHLIHVLIFALTLMTGSSVRNVCFVKFSTTTRTQVLGLSVASSHCVREPQRMSGLFVSNAHWMLSWNTMLLLSSLIRRRMRWEKMLIKFDLPLVRDPSVSGCCSNAVHPLLALQHIIDTICDRTRVLKPSLYSWSVFGSTVHLRPTCLRRRVGDSKPSILDEVASALLFLDDSFEGSAATENAPPLRIKVLSRCFWQSNIGPSWSESTMDPNPSDQIGRLMSNTRQLLWPFLLQWRGSPVSFRAVGLVSLNLLSAVF